MEAHKLENNDEQKIELKVVEAKKVNPFIVGKWQDYVFFVFTPLIALFIGHVGAEVSTVLENKYPQWDMAKTNPIIALGTIMTLGHLIIVFFRSHLNKKIFKEFPIRFTLIPPILYFALVISPYMLALMTIVITWWDVYHSGLQTFGLGRIYDSKMGNDSNAGRRMDYFLNLFIYVGPILGGVTFFSHLKPDAANWATLSDALLYKIPVIEQNTKSLAIFFSITGALFLAGYIYHYRALKKQGYKYPKLKLALFLSTAITSIVSWGFNPYGVAFFIMNFFHAIQYFAIVYYFEKKNLSEVLHLNNFKWKNFAIFSLICGTALAYAWLTGTYTKFNNPVYYLAFFHVVSVMHFWYDGFIWSVRKKHV